MSTRKAKEVWVVSQIDIDFVKLFENWDDAEKWRSENMPRASITYEPITPTSFANRTKKPINLKSSN